MVQPHAVTGDNVTMKTLHVNVMLVLTELTVPLFLKVKKCLTRHKLCFIFLDLSGSKNQNQFSNGHCKTSKKVG